MRHMHKIMTSLLALVLLLSMNVISYAATQDAPPVTENIIIEYEATAVQLPSLRAETDQWVRGFLCSGQGALAGIDINVLMNGSTTYNNSGGIISTGFTSVRSVHVDRAPSGVRVYEYNVLSLSPNYARVWVKGNLASGQLFNFYCNMYL